MAVGLLGVLRGAASPWKKKDLAIESSSSGTAHDPSEPECVGERSCRSGRRRQFGALTPKGAAQGRFGALTPKHKPRRAWTEVMELTESLESEATRTGATEELDEEAQPEQPNATGYAHLLGQTKDEQQRSIQSKPSALQRRVQELHDESWSVSAYRSWKNVESNMVMVAAIEHLKGRLEHHLYFSKLPKHEHDRLKDTIDLMRGEFKFARDNLAELCRDMESDFFAWLEWYEKFENGKKIQLSAALREKNAKVSPIPNTPLTIAAKLSSLGRLQRREEDLPDAKGALPFQSMWQLGQLITYLQREDGSGMLEDLLSLESLILDRILPRFMCDLNEYHAFLTVRIEKGRAMKTRLLAFGLSTGIMIFTTFMKSSAANGVEEIGVSFAQNMSTGFLNLPKSFLAVTMHA